MKTERKEENAVVLDVLPMGYVSEQRPAYKREPVVQAVGVDQFKLLELIPKQGADIQIYDRVYIGDAEREKIERVKRRISHEDLTATAKLELPFVIEQIVNENEQRFVDFFNKSVPITPKFHMLHLLPGIGKKLLWEILEQREKKPFESFADISARIKSLPHPGRMIVSRILHEIEDPDEKYHVFTSR
ncbi:MAG: putative nucleotide binding protein [Euryarchaeota archaeon]|jgi:putative nucleotide binding protein|nr:putative nucleotide binding protein [Euryarchaeota archaeon]MDN5339228.1 putative nucleotide binding protein [Euryarchaeota archaeon]